MATQAAKRGNATLNKVDRETLRSPLPIRTSAV